MRMLANGYSDYDVLKWLERHDTDERAIWVEQYRTSNKTMGQVIKAVMELRESSWEPPEAVQARGGGQPGSSNDNTPTRTRNVRQQAQRTSHPLRTPTKGNHNPGQKNKQWGNVDGLDGPQVFELRDGKKICMEFNRGGCSKRCPKDMVHICSKMLRNGRACGMRNHCSRDCKNKR